MITGNEYIHPVIGMDPINGPTFGMTLRQYYAGLAMQGMSFYKEYPSTEQYAEEWIARRAVRIADALIEALNKSEDHAKNT